MVDTDIYCQENICSESKIDNPVNSHLDKKEREVLGKKWGCDVSSPLLLSIFLLQTEKGFAPGD